MRIGCRNKGIERIKIDKKMWYVVGGAREEQRILAIMRKRKEYWIERCL